MIRILPERKMSLKNIETSRHAVSTMNILFTSDYFLPHAGGSRVYYFNLYSRMVTRFPDRLTVLTKKVHGWQEFDSRVATEMFRIVRRFKPLPSWQARQLPKIIFPLISTLWCVLRESVDIIHPGDLYPQGVIARLMKELFGIPYIAYCHGEDITMTDKYRYQPRVRDWIYRGADVVVAACEFAVENLVRIGVEKQRIVKITPGVDFVRFAPRPPSKDLISQYGLQGRKVLLTVARLVPRKGHEAVIRAIAKLVETQRNLTYLIVGLGPEREKLQRLVAELGLNEVVKFTGYVAEDRLADFYNVCDIFVMANQEADGDIEGFGMVFLEANSSGKPVIAGRSGGTADSVIDGVTGYRVEPTDVDGLSATISRLLTNPDLCAHMGAAGLRRAREEFDWEKRAARIRQLSLKAVEKRRAQLHGVSDVSRSILIE
jgi:phosphatidylinositol alpha-1,6-mannosyltransferase